MNLLRNWPFSCRIFSLWNGALLFVPFAASLLLFCWENAKVEELGERVLFVQNKMQTQNISKSKEKKNLTLIKTSRPSYLQESLESLPLLKRERQKWKIHTAQVAPSEKVKKRMEFLDSPLNHLEFSQGKTKKTSLFLETPLKQKRAVEINEEDLKAILCLVEGVEIGPYTPKAGAPQLLITSFSLEKKPTEETGERNYMLHMDLIKREQVK